MFGKNEKERVEPVQAAPPPPPQTHVQPQVHHQPAPVPVPERTGNTVLAEGSAFQGTLRVQGSLTIHGAFEGSVSCTESLLIGKTARIKADIEAKSAVVGGRVEGSVHVKERVELQTGCTLLGDVHARSFVIQDDCHYQGKCIMGKQQTDTGHIEVKAGNTPDLGLIQKKA